MSSNLEKCNSYKILFYLHAVSLFGSVAVRGEHRKQIHSEGLSLDSMPLATSLRTAAHLCKYQVWPGEPARLMAISAAPQWKSWSSALVKTCQQSSGKSQSD